MVYSRIFLFSCLLCIFQQVNAEQCYQVGTQKFSTPETACAGFWAKYPSGTNKTYYFDTSGTYAGKLRCYISKDGSNNQAYNIVPCDNNCPPLNQIHSSITFKRNGEVFDAPSSVCVNKCLYDYINTVIGQEVRTDGSIISTLVGDGKSKNQSCPTNTTDDTPPPLNPCKRLDTTTGNYVDKDYCDKPPNIPCPSGYIQGSFNGRLVCVRSNRNEQDNCRATAADPYRCLPDRPQEPTNPNNEGNCSNGTVQVIIGTTLKCVTPEVPPNPDGDCPNNYVKQTYDGVSVCVPDNQRPDVNNNCPLNTSIKTLPDGTKVCSSNGGNDNGSGASEPTGESGSGQCNPETDFLCKDFDLPIDQKLDVKDVNLPEIDENKISWSQSCPADETVNVMGKTYAFKYNDACSFLSNYIHPLMVAFGYLTGAFIIVGAARK